MRTQNIQCCFRVSSVERKSDQTLKLIPRANRHTYERTYGSTEEVHMAGLGDMEEWILGWDLARKLTI